MHCNKVLLSRCLVCQCAYEVRSLSAYLSIQELHEGFRGTHEIHYRGAIFHRLELVETVS